uniref:Uncharacterized protein n=1 Tax=Strigamia maritima TaxID=126957 RepID=T1JEA3_STRMM
MSELIDLKSRKKFFNADSWSPGHRHRLLAEIEPDDFEHEDVYVKNLTEFTERRCRFSLRRVFQRLLEVRNRNRELISSTINLSKDYRDLHVHLSKVTKETRKLKTDLEDVWYLDHIIESLGRQESSITLVPYRVEEC